MFNSKKLSGAAVALALAVSAPAGADQPGEPARADDHAPIGVMGDHLHDKGEWMVSYRFMRMRMDGNRDGTDGIDPGTIVTTAPNRFFGMPGQPPTLRVVPETMTTDMHMFGLMYAPSDRVTLMLMANYLEKEMGHVTWQGPMGTTVLGRFTTRTEGLGDTSISALVGLFDNGSQRAHLTLGLSLPTGDIEESGTVLTPMGMTPSLRLPYPMQLGSGSYDPILGITWAGRANAWGWGAQWRSVLRVADNDEDYRLGDEHRLNVWLSRLLTPGASLSLRLEGYDRGNISGQDRLIMAPVQTADPDRHAARRLGLGIGLNLAGSGDLAGHRLAFEFHVPLYQDLDGPQMESDWMLTAGYQYAF
ncbi:transporter [Elongatibacter sediminis]|uniref:Transporter n=1 Tax=Elongatibacter sediminis TaxID=3119006 RepID=A0AAW9RIB3_9GAMM